jgi:hypothetical protein
MLSHEDILYAVLVVDKALRYKPKGRDFET